MAAYQENVGPVDSLTPDNAAGHLDMHTRSLDLRALLREAACEGERPCS
jgi:hypothetical protein